MTKVFKAFRSDLRTFFHTVGETQSFRITGDCTPAQSAVRNFND